MRVLLLASLVALSLVAGCSCGPERPNGSQPNPNVRCEVDLEATGLFSEVGTSARARVLESGDPALAPQAGYPTSALPGDVVLENDRIRVVLSQTGRHPGPVPFGGWIVDADVRRAPGEPTRDQFGRMGLSYAFNRTVEAAHVEILKTGEAGGPAVVAVTGKDVLNDFLLFKDALRTLMPGAANLAIDPDAPIALKATTYYVLSPGETRLRAFTQLCNEAPEDVAFPIGDLIDPGGTLTLFNPSGCTGVIGEGCGIDPAGAFFFQGDGVAYGYRGYRTENVNEPSDDALVSLGGAWMVLNGAAGSSGVAAWTDLQATNRPGTFALRGGESRAFLRDFFVARDLGELHTTLMSLDREQSGRLVATVQEPDGAPAPGARVAVRGAANRIVTILVAGADGKARADLPPGTWAVQAMLPGHAIVPAENVQVGTNGTVEKTLTLGASRALFLTVQDPLGSPLPAKVTVTCPSGTCPAPVAKYAEVFGVDPLPANVAAVAFVPSSGLLTLPLAPGLYEVVVTRGPEFSAFPGTWPASGEAVDLTSADRFITATLARVVDTTDWMSADLDAHSVNSADSSVPNEVRIRGFLAEGIDIAVSLNADSLTLFHTDVEREAAQSLLGTVVGTEIPIAGAARLSVFPFPLLPDSSEPFDWAGATGPTLRPAEVFDAFGQGVAATQLLDARGPLGAFTRLRVDTDTLATHAEPAPLRMTAAPDATASDTRLLGESFDAFQVLRGVKPSNALLNDWMTMLSSGRVKAATGGSGSRDSVRTPAGYARTYVKVGIDSPPQLNPVDFKSAVTSKKVLVTNGPFVTVSARRLEGGTTPVGNPVGPGETLSITTGDAVEIAVDVQAPDWMRFDTLELHTHADGREALDGAPNERSPQPAATASFNPAALPLDTLDINGQQFRRVHLSHTFTAAATRDTWFVVILRAAQAASLAPLAYEPVTCSGAVCTAANARPWAITQAILIDADGSGAYDNFPQGKR